MTDYTTNVTPKTTRNYTRQPIEQRFWKYVNKTETCWLWTGATRRFGYGVINAGGNNGKGIAAHRASWEIHFGLIPLDMCVLHVCDNPACVRPDHLFLGTYADNYQDMKQKGRASGSKLKGQDCHKAKLTEKQVLEIRALYAESKPSFRIVGERYGVTFHAIYDIVKRRSWPHI